VACLYAEGRLSEGEVYRQEGIVGSVFEATVALRDGAIVPTVTGRAWVNAESTLWIDPTDPFAWGIPR
jgi:4-hydroxyproline epimerase